LTFAAICGIVRTMGNIKLRQVVDSVRALFDEKFREERKETTEFKGIMANHYEGIQNRAKRTEVLAKYNVLAAKLSLDNLYRFLEDAEKPFTKDEKGRECAGQMAYRAYELVGLAKQQILNNVTFSGRAKGLDDMEKINLFHSENQSMGAASNKILDECTDKSYVHGDYVFGSKYFQNIDKYRFTISNGDDRDIYGSKRLGNASADQEERMLYSPKDQFMFGGIHNKLACTLRDMSVTERIGYLTELGLSSDKASDFARNYFDFNLPIGITYTAKPYANKEKIEQTQQYMQELVEVNFQKMSALNVEEPEF